MKQYETKSSSNATKSSHLYKCIFCDYNTYKRCNYNKHLQTIKHNYICIETNETTMKHSKIEKKYQCKNCDLKIHSRTTLWRHKKICEQPPNNLTYSTIIPENNMNITPELVLELIKNNKELMNDKNELINEFKNIIMEQNNTINNLVKNGINNTNNSHNNNNSHNKTFNLQFFLNETCKDAMNIMDFVDSIKLQLSDLERIGEIGYTQGISDIITTNLKALDVTQRPVHCTDKKRETIYVKDENQWTKEDDNKPKIRKMIKHIENKNIQILPKFREKYPNYANPKSIESDKYNKTIIEAVGGIGDAETKENKIIRNISKIIAIRENE